MTIAAERIRVLSDAPVAAGRYVLYWMQQAQRAVGNPALDYAAEAAAALAVPVVAGFGLTAGYPEANARHFAFMLQGLAETVHELDRRGIPLVVRLGDPAEVALELARDARLVVCDRGTLRHQHQWRRRVAMAAGRRVVEIETDVVVPAETASTRHEIAARTLRPRLHRLLDRFLVASDPPPPVPDGRALGLASAFTPAAPLALLARLDIDRDVAPVRGLVGGRSQALARLDAWLIAAAAGESERRDRPPGCPSRLGPYLHFGQVSPVELALRVGSAPGLPAGERDRFLEQLIIRRELSVNHVLNDPAYDRYDTVPGWARATLAVHAADPRPALYSPEQLERGETADAAWNAAMTEMRATGFLHNHMRMYWGKKILEWSATPEAAFATALTLNNRYFLDGRDPNSYAGVAWLFGLHDRPHPERPVFGTVRSMTAAGLARKFDVKAWIAASARRVAAEGGG